MFILITVKVKHSRVEQLPIIKKLFYPDDGINQAIYGSARLNEPSALLSPLRFPFGLGCSSFDAVLLFVLLLLVRYLSFVTPRKVIFSNCCNLLDLTFIVNIRR